MAPNNKSMSSKDSLRESSARFSDLEMGRRSTWSAPAPATSISSATAPWNLWAQGGKVFTALTELERLAVRGSDGQNLVPVEEVMAAVGPLCPEEHDILCANGRGVDIDDLRDRVKRLSAHSHWRDGSTPPATLSFYNVTCQYQNPSGVVTVLHETSATIEPGSLVAMLGPSGAGKSTLLDILAMRKTVGKLGGVITVNGFRRDPETFRVLSAYVAQEDTFLPTLTVKETLMFVIHLRLGSSMSFADKNKRLKELLEEVGLADKEASKVGGPLAGGIHIRGLSGGEKRRLSICCGAVASPSLLFLDEPTSGLDAMSSLLVMDVMKAYTQRGATVIATIHQPRKEIFEMFDQMMLLSKGRLLYNGSVHEARGWFEQVLKYPMPASTSLPDYLLDLVNISFTKPATLFGERTMRTLKDVEAAYEAYTVSPHWIAERRQSAIASLMQLRLTSHGDSALARLYERQVSKLLEFRVLLKRSFLSYVRNPGNVAARLVVYSAISLLQGGAFYKLSADNVQNRLGSLFFGTIVNQLLPYCSLGLFIHDRVFFSRDSAAGLYTTALYYLASTIMEIMLAIVLGSLYSIFTFFLVGAPGGTGTFVTYLMYFIVMNLLSTMWVQVCAATAPNQDVAFVMAAGYTAASVLMSGFLVSFGSLGKTVAWVQWVTFQKYAFQGLSINEFLGTDFLTPVIDDVFKLNTPATVMENFGALLSFILVFGFWTFLSLHFLYRERR